MKTRCTEFDHDLMYGRDIRIAGAVALVSVIAAFLFAPQPQVAPYRVRVPAEWNLTIEEPLPVIYNPPEPAEQAPRGVPMASDNPEASTIAPNTDFKELKPDVTAPTIETNVPFWKVERKPRLVREVVPYYPEMARAAGIEGKVVVSMVVDTLGNVVSAGVYATSGNTLLDQAAVEAAYKCGFTPGFQRDRPVVVRNVILPFNFRLQ
jgi:periplasmic protein TonB